MFSVHIGSHKFSRRFASVHIIFCVGSHGSHNYFSQFTLTESLATTLCLYCTPRQMARLCTQTSGRGPTLGGGQVCNSRGGGRGTTFPGGGQGKMLGICNLNAGVHFFFLKKNMPAAHKMKGFCIKKQII
jgi:hypothetical protein